MIREVVVFCYGDSRKASTWSNIPYLFSKELEKRGIIIKRVDLNLNWKLEYLYDCTIYRWSQRIWPNNIFSFVRTPLARFFIYRKIKAEVKKNHKADLCVFFCFDFYNKFNRIPSLLICDWTLNILLEMEGRKPYFFERYYCNLQRDVIQKADYVVSLFHGCASKMRNDCAPCCNIFSMGKNVINLLYEEPVTEQNVLSEKKGRNKILFIGKEKYKDALMLLMQALRDVKREIPNIELNVIGMTSEQVGISDDSVHFYGYLRKDNEEENVVYYNLMKSSNVVVNVTPQWAGYSSIIESMFFYTPVIISPFNEFVSEFGSLISFGIYNLSYSKDCLAGNISKLLKSDRYWEMCISAHNKVKDYTWGRYVDEILNMVENYNRITP